MTCNNRNYLANLTNSAMPSGIHPELTFPRILARHASGFLHNNVAGGHSTAIADVQPVRPIQPGQSLFNACKVLSPVRAFCRERGILRLNRLL